MDWIPDTKYLYYVVIAFVVLSIGELIERLYLHAKRKRDACHQREVYHQKLEYDSLVIECKKLKEELQSAETICHLKDETNKLEEQLKGDNRIEIDDFSFEDKLEHLSNELAELQDRAKELEIVDRDICQERERLSEDGNSNELSDNKNYEPSFQELTSNIGQLEANNHKLESQLACHKPVLAPNCLIDPEVSKFIDKHENELTLDYLEKAYDTLLELKASNPSKSFDDHIKGIKSKQDYMTELAELRLENKQAEIKFKMIKKRYESELKTFNEFRVEHIFKICGSRQYSGVLKTKSQFLEELKTNLVREYETKSSERNILWDKFHDAEKQCNEYWQAWKDTEVRREQIEAERRANLEKERRLLDQSMNFSSRSSLSAGSQIPPPPPIIVPSIDEVLRQTANQSIGSHYGNFSMNNPPPSIPSPPPVEVPVIEAFGNINNNINNNRSLNSMSNRSTSSTGGDNNNRTRVGSRYGTVFNSRSGNLAQ